MRRLISTAVLLLFATSVAFAQTPQPPFIPNPVPPANGGTGSISITQYNAIADTFFFSDGAITATTATFASTAASFTSTDVGKLISVSGAGAAGAPLITTIQAVGSAHSITLTATAGTTVSGALFGYGTDNTANIQSAFNAAVSAKVPVTGPANPNGGCYGLTPPFTLGGNLQINGTWVAANWGGGINVPLGTPQLVGSVLCPVSNGSDLFVSTGTSYQISGAHFGVLWQTPFSNTGDMLHYIPTGTNQGLTRGIWKDVIIFGHDGNHYAFNLQNPIYMSFEDVTSYGGGALKFYGNSSTGNFGNTHFKHVISQVIAGGSSDCYNFAASAAQRMNLIAFDQLQCIINNVSGVTPAGNPPTNAQQMVRLDGNVQNIALGTGGDLETNVGAGFTMGTAAQGNSIDFTSLFTDAAFINAPGWGTNGIMFAPATQTFTDTTSTGTVAVQTINAFPGTHVKASNPVTYTRYATLYLAPPIAGTNVTIGTPETIHSTGVIFNSANYTGTGGLFITGNTIQLNHNSNFVTQIGDGTTNANVTIGGSANTVALGNTVTHAGTMTAAALSTVGTIAGSICMTSGGLFLYEAGATGCTISRADLKDIMGTISPTEAWSAINVLDPIAFKFKQGTSRPQLGFTAENAQAADPRLATYDGDGKLQAYDPNGMIALLTVALKEQQHQAEMTRMMLIALASVVALYIGSSVVRRRFM